MKVGGLMPKQRNVPGSIFDFPYLVSLQGKRLAWAQEVDQRINTNGLPLKRYVLTLTFFIFFLGNGVWGNLFVLFWFISISILLYKMASRARCSKSNEGLHVLNARYFNFFIQVLIDASIWAVLTFQVLFVKCCDFIKWFSFHSIVNVKLNKQPLAKIPRVLAGPSKCPHRFVIL